MTDTTVAPPSAAPQSASVPASNEVPINPNPTSSPNPIGSQAPPAEGDVKGSEHRPQSRREAIQRAFERASQPQAKPKPAAEKPAPKAAEAKPGHNQPPEETEKIDLKKRPATADQPRGERGQFAPKQREDAQITAQIDAKGTQTDAQTAQTAKQLPEGTPFRDPPQRISERAKADWHATPESVRGDFHRQQQEFAKAYQTYKGSHDAFQPVAKFHQMAEAHGTTLEKALSNYTSMEHKLRTDVIGGLDIIVNNLDLRDPQTGQKLGLRDVAYSVLNQSPEQLRQVQQGNAQQAAGQQIGALHNEIMGLKQSLQQMHTQQQFSYTRAAVDQFAETHPRFDELGVAIQQELQYGYDLETAYRRAELLHPGTHAAQTGTTTAQTRTIDRSISGAPSVTGSNPASRRPKEPSRSPRDAVANAMKHMNGSF